MDMIGVEWPQVRCVNLEWRSLLLTLVGRRRKHCRPACRLISLPKVTRQQSLKNPDDVRGEEKMRMNQDGSVLLVSGRLLSGIVPGEFRPSRIEIV